MLGQLEQYEIVKGQIWQQYYSSIEEKVKSDWFMNLYGAEENVIFWDQKSVYYSYRRGK